MTNLISVAFRGGDIFVTADQQIALKPVCDAMGLDFEGQRQRLERQRWATTCVMQAVAEDGKTRDMVTVDRRTFTMWLATIETSRLKNESAREQVAIFQSEAADVLDAHFHGDSKPSTTLDLPQDYEAALVALVEQVRENKRQAKAIEAAQAYAKELEPKADSYDQFLSADGTYSIGSVAKMLGQSQNKLFDLLRNSGILIAKGAMRNTPYQQYMHHFRVVAFDFERSDQTRGTSYTTRVQPSGVQFISRKLGIALVEVSA